MNKRQILVTAALPYANGHIHIGHMLEHIQTDIWTRFQKLRGHRCIFVCADDTHGTPIMMRARQEGRPETELIAEMSLHHQRDIGGFGVQFDNYGSTNSSENEVLCGDFWAALRQADLVVEREITQLFDPIEGVFLADRFVRGTCPRCQTPEQYGDNCDKCGHTYQPTDLIDPVSLLSGAKPEPRPSKQLFVRLEQLHEFLNQYALQGDHLQPEVANYLKGHFLHEPLRDWDVSRPAPYFGFEIPDAAGNYWYVWFDAPIGYLASTQQWCEQHGESLDQWWRNPGCEVHHFIGKDITYFHTLFWPAMLHTAGCNLPTKVHIHGFLTVDGRKMSKRDGTFIMASTYLKHLDPVYFRYYLASKLGPRLDDLDLNLKEFASRVNSDLVNKVVNLASRSAKFLAETPLSSPYPDDGGLFARGAQAGDEIAEAYEACDYQRAMRTIMELADQANAFVEHRAPWQLKKDPARQQEMLDVCSVGLNLFWQIIVYLSPVTPSLARSAEELLGCEITDWKQAQQPLEGGRIAKFKHMLQRIDQKDIDRMIEESRPDEPAPSEAQAPAAAPQDSGDALAAEPLAEQCTIDEFVKVDLRVARVLKAEDVAEARKLLKLTLSLGGDQQRTVFAGIKAAYAPEDLVGSLVVMVANLAPRTMKFGVSEGMVIASGGGGKEVHLLRPDPGAQPGQRVH